MAVPLSSPRLRAPSSDRRVSPTGAVLATPAMVRATQPRAGLAPRRKLATPRVALKSPASSARKPEDKGLIGGALASIGNIISFPGTVIKSLPTLVGKGAQSVVGFGETLFDLGADIINPNLYTSRSEVDLAKGRELGLKGADLLAYSMQRTVPLLAPVVESIPKTGARFAETASGGLGTRLLTGRNYIDFNEPGFDYGRALRQGQLGTMLIEDIGNVMLGGRALGLGNLGVQAGSRISAAGAPRLGRAVGAVGRFSEEPIATTTKGAARAALRLPEGRFRPSPRVLSAVAESPRPLATLAAETGAGFRNIAQRRVIDLDKKMGDALRKQDYEQDRGNKIAAEEAAKDAARYDQKRKFWFRLSETQLRGREQVRAGQAEAEAVKTMFNQTAIRYGQQGSVPEAPAQLRTRAENLRAQAQGQSDPVFQARLVEQADFLDRKASVKESNPEKLDDRENRNVNFSAAVIITSKLIDEVMADLDAGKTFDEVYQTIQQRELIPEVAQQGYQITPQALQRAIDFARNQVDEVDRLDMDVASSVLASFANYLEGLATQPGTLVSGVLSPAQFGDTAVPELFVLELNGRAFESEVLIFLDETVPAVVEEYFPDLAEQLGDSMDKPRGLFKRFAGSRPDTPEYAVARIVLLLAEPYLANPETSVFRDTPRIAVQVAQFFKNPAIYPARIRPMVAYAESRAQEAGAADVRTTLTGLKRVLEEYGDLVSEGRRVSLGKLLEEMSDPRKQFDREFYQRVQDYLAGVLGDLQRRRSATTARQGVIEGRTAESDARLAAIETQARAAAGMVEQALLRPEELPTVSETARRAELDAEIARLQSEGDVAGAARLVGQREGRPGLTGQGINVGAPIPENILRSIDRLNEEIARLREAGDNAGAARLIGARETLLGRAAGEVDFAALTPEEAAFVQSQGETAARLAGTREETPKIPDATIQRSLDNVETGKPFEAVLYRGTGGVNVQGTGADSLFGPGVYATPDLQYAETFASDFTDVARPRLVGNVEQVSVRLRNPLVIRTADQWRNLTREAGWEFPKISRGSDARPLLASLRQLIESQGYDGVIIKYDPNMPPNSALADMAGGEQVVAFSPEAVMPAERRARLGGVTQESQALRQQADELRAEASRLQTQTDPLNQLRLDIETENTKLDAARDTQANLEAEVQQLQTRLEREQKLLDDAALDEEGMVLLLAEIDEAASLARSGIGVDPTLTEQKAWKEQKIREAREREDLAARNFESISGGAVPAPERRGDLKATATGGVQEVNVRRRGGLAINKMWLDQEDYANYIARGIPNRSHRRAFFRDHTVKGKRRDPATGIEMPTEGSTIGEVAGALSEEEFLTRLTQAYSDYMNARDEVKRLETMPFKGKYGEQVKEAMIEDQRELLSGYPWINPITGKETRGISPLGELRQVEAIARDQDTLAEQVRLVRNLQEEVRTKQASLQSARRATQEIDKRIAEMAFRSGQIEGSSPRFQASRLLNNAERLVTEADRLEAENVRLRPTVAKERITLTRQSGKRLRAANARRAEGREVTGYEFTKGVAKKLDDAQTAELREQQRLHDETLKLQDQLNQQDAALGESVAVRQASQQYEGALGAPTPRATLQRAVVRPRLLGETSQPTFIPVGEASGVRPVAALDVTMRGEGMAPESKISIERRRTSTYMAQTPEQFAARIKDILGQVARNRVVARIIQDEMLTSDVQTIVGESRLAELRQQAEQQVLDQGINRGTEQFDTNVEKTYGDSVVRELEIMGYEPISPVKMPEEGDIYSGRGALGALTERVSGDVIEPTTLVMRRGLRESLSSYFEPEGGGRIPPRLAAIFDRLGKYTARWKSVVLPFSLRWQVGDAMGNIINAHVRAGISPFELAGRVQEVYRRLQEPGGLNRREVMMGDLFGSNVADPVIQVLLGAGLQAYGIRLSDLKEMHPSKSLKPPPGITQGGGFRPFFPRFREKSFAFNETQNGMVRSAVAIAKLEEALQARGRNINEIDPVTIHNDPVLYEAVREAVEQANDALGNFSQLSPYEKQFVRQVYPFWSWVKFINKAAAQLVISQPDRVLFYAHLGSMATGDDGNDLYDWLKNQTAVPIPGIGTVLIDLSFTNPYSDAIIFGRNPIEESTEVATNVSPILRAGLRTGGEIAYGVSGRRFPLLETVSRPGYLEGRPGTTTRGLGDVLGGIAYQNFRTFAGPYRFLTDVAPTVRVPGTDVLLGPGPRYGQGSPRTTGVYSRPLLSPTQERIGAVLQGLGVPAPSAQLSEAQAQGRQIRRTGIQSLRRRERERRLSRIRQ